RGRDAFGEHVANFRGIESVAEQVGLRVQAVGDRFELRDLRKTGGVRGNILLEPGVRGIRPCGAGGLLPSRSTDGQVAARIEIQRLRLRPSCSVWCPTDDDEVARRRAIHQDFPGRERAILGRVGVVTVDLYLTA